MSEAAALGDHIGPATAVRPFNASYVRSTDLLADVVEAAAEGDLRGVLPRLAELTLEASDADRVSFFLLDEGAANLVLWAVAGKRRNDDLWNRGMAMAPIPLEMFPGIRELFELDAPVAVRDGYDSPLVPRDWAEAFGLASLIVAPLRMGDEHLGLLVVDYRTPRDVPEEVVIRIGAIARSSALAVANASLSERLAQRAAGLQSLLGASKALLGSGSLGEIAEKVADAIVDVLGAQHLSVHLLEDAEPYQRFRTLVQRGVELPLEGTVKGLPPRAAARIASSWRKGRPAPMVLENPEHGVRDRNWPVPAELGCVLVLPLCRSDSDVFGFVLVGLPRSSPPTAITLELAGALATHVAFAVDRARLLEQVAVGAELACALLAMGGGEQSGPEGALARLRATVPPAVGFSIVDVYLPTSDRRSPARPQFQRQLWRQWRHRRQRPASVEHDGDVYVPVWGREGMVGVVQAKPVGSTLAPHQRDLLDAVASALGELIDRQRADAQMFLRERELALANERSEAASELHGIVGALLAGVEAAADDLTDPPAGIDEVALRIKRLTRAARAELTEGGASLDTFIYDPRGLGPTLSEVVSRLSERLDAAADLEVRGTPRELPVGVDQTLVRVLHEAFARIEEGSRSSAIAVRLNYEPGSVELEVRDDGVALVSRDAGPARPGPHFGIRLIQQRVEALGGRLAVERPGPRGLLLRARIPA